MWKSRKFRAVVYNFVASAVLFFGAKYLGPNAAEDVKYLVAGLQAPVMMYIWGVAHEDGQEKRNHNIRPKLNYDINEADIERTGEVFTR